MGNRFSFPLRCIFLILFSAGMMLLHCHHICDAVISPIILERLPFPFHSHGPVTARKHRRVGSPWSRKPRAKAWSRFDMLFIYMAIYIACLAALQSYRRTPLPLAHTPAFSSHSFLVIIIDSLRGYFIIAFLQHTASLSARGRTPKYPTPS